MGRYFPSLCVVSYVYNVYCTTRCVQSFISISMQHWTSISVLTLSSLNETQADVTVKFACMCLCVRVGMRWNGIKMKMENQMESSSYHIKSNYRYNMGSMLWKHIFSRSHCHIIGRHRPSLTTTIIYHDLQ